MVNRKGSKEGKWERRIVVDVEKRERGRERGIKFVFEKQKNKKRQKIDKLIIKVLIYFKPQWTSLLFLERRLCLSLIYEGEAINISSTLEWLGCLFEMRVKCGMKSALDCEVIWENLYLFWNLSIFYLYIEYTQDNTRFLKRLWEASLTLAFPFW